MKTPKSTSYGYGRDYQLAQAEKYRNRQSNNWQFRIGLAKSLVERYILPRLERKKPQDIVVVDVGCSIGTFAIEFAKYGYQSFGIDFDESALEIARQLAKEQDVMPEFFCQDIADLKTRLPRIDIAVCFDIFEHLHDDELGALLTAIRRQLSDQGSLVFHTCPTQYDYLFFGRGHIGYPLVLLRWLSAKKFAGILKAYSCMIDIAYIALKGGTYLESIKLSGHCNPTTSERLRDSFLRTGYDVLAMESSNLYEPKRMFSKVICKHLSNQPITHRNLYGVAIPANVAGL
jgi:2-polyprenyl-3-methyl-5-hydroxy-6-metoxy-1,4-benzoquinol methylase